MYYLNIYMVQKSNLFLQFIRNCGLTTKLLEEYLYNKLTSEVILRIPSVD